MRRIVKVGGAFGLFSVAIVSSILIAWWLRPPVADPGAGFERIDIDLPAWEWYDAGAVDANTDGKLDIYTINHAHPHVVFTGDGAGGFTESLAALGLSQDPAFPGLFDDQAPPPRRNSGLHLFWHDGALVFDTIGASRPYRGSVHVPGAVDVVTSGAAIVTTDGQAHGMTEVAFRFPAAGSISLRPQTPTVPINIRLADDIDPTQVFVGTLGVSPSSARFTIYLRDRHGVAWADINEDGIPDAYITRGGMTGRMAVMPGSYSDELLLSVGQGRYVERAADTGFEKGACPGRQVGWVDFNLDGRLDLYVVCGRYDGEFANQFYERTADNRFVDVAARHGLDFVELGPFAWTDVDRDGDPDLLWASRGGVWLYRNEIDSFTPEQLHGPSLIGFEKIALGDIDSDNYPDALVAGSQSNVLLINEAGNLASEPPAKFGLPLRSKTAAWLDFDNDGMLDFHAWPQGIYRQQLDGSFAATGVASLRSPFWWLVDARTIWFDFDTDGDQDLLLLQRFVPRFVQGLLPSALPFTAALYRNEFPVANHWLQIDLLSDLGDPAAIGATVTVPGDSGRVQVHQVGQYDNAHYSQGHYRVHVGLGDADVIEALTIHWPDGSNQTLRGIAADQLLSVTKAIGPDAPARMGRSNRSTTPGVL